MHTADHRARLTIEALRGPLLTRRLILRAPRTTDLVAIARLINDPVIAVNTGVIRYPYSAISGRRWIESVRAASAVAAPTFHAALFLTLRSNPRLIAGAVGITVGKHGAPTIGYWIAKAHRRRGFATEAARAVIDLAFSRSGLAAIEATARVSNIASQRVLLGTGMRRIGNGRTKSAQLGRYVPMLRFRIERKAWENARPARRDARGVHEAL